DEIHHDNDQVVAPAISVLAPEASLPSKYLLLGRAQHARIRPAAANWASTPAATPSPPASSASPRNSVKPLPIPMLWAGPAGSLICDHPLVMKIAAIINRMSSSAASRNAGGSAIIDGSPRFDVKPLRLP